MSIMEIEEIVTILREKLSHKQVTTNETIRSQHGKDESYHQEHLPDIVVFPHTTNQVSEVMAFANEEKIPVTPFGLGSSLEGHVIPYEGGIRSEEHTSELQSRFDLVCCLLLEKKNLYYSYKFD